MSLFFCCTWAWLGKKSKPGVGSEGWRAWIWVQVVVLGSAIHCVLCDLGKDTSFRVTISIIVKRGL